MPKKANQTSFKKGHHMTDEQNIKWEKSMEKVWLNSRGKQPHPWTEESRKRLSKTIGGKNHPRSLPIFTEKIEERRGKEYVLIKTGYKRSDWMYKHRYVVEQYYGIKLTPKQVIHHLDGDTLNNSIENLYITNACSHNQIHFTIDKWSIRHDCCVCCGTNERKHASNGLCTKCYQQAKAKERGYWL